jgi:hypothetical protein
MKYVMIGFLVAVDLGVLVAVADAMCTAAHTLRCVGHDVVA